MSANSTYFYKQKANARFWFFVLCCIIEIESRWVMEIQNYQEKNFEDIKHFNENNEEYW